MTMEQQTTPTGATTTETTTATAGTNEGEAGQVEQQNVSEQQEPVKPALFDEGEQPEEQQPAEQPKETTPTVAELKAEDLKLPEGTSYDEELGTSFIGILNDEKLTRQELGQKLLDLYHSQGLKMTEALKAAEDERAKKFAADMAQEKAEWIKQCEADKEYGGQNWEASQAVIDRGCKHLATPEAVKLMQAYNLNTHPEIVRMFYRAGKWAGEDNSAINGGNTAKPNDPAMAIFGESLKDYHKRRGEI